MILVHSMVTLFNGWPIGSALENLHSCYVLIGPEEGIPVVIPHRNHDVKASAGWLAGGQKRLEAFGCRGSKDCAWGRLPGLGIDSLYERLPSARLTNIDIPNDPIIMRYAIPGLLVDRCGRKRINRGDAMLGRDHWALLVVLPLVSTVHLFNSSLLDFGGYHYDAWMFVYGGQEILAGRTPYLDFWDNKPPLIFLLNAFGLLLGGGSHLGVCFLENVLLMAAAWLGFCGLRDAFGLLPAFVASCAWVLTAAFLVDGSNGTMTYALLGLFLSWRCLVRLYSEARDYRSGLLFGMATGYLLLLKPTLVGTNGVLVAVLLMRHLRQRHGRAVMIQAACALAGFAVLVLPVFAYIWSRGALAMMIDNAWYFPTRFLLSPNWSVRFGHIAHVSRDLLFRNGILLVSIIGLCPLIWPACLRELRSLRRAVILCAVASLGLEVWISSLTGRPWAHYLLPWLPNFAILSASATLFLGHMAKALCRGLSFDGNRSPEPGKHVPAAQPDHQRNVAGRAPDRGQRQRPSDHRAARLGAELRRIGPSRLHQRLRQDMSFEAVLDRLWTRVARLGLPNIMVGFVLASALGWMTYLAGRECLEYTSRNRSDACDEVITILKNRSLSHRTLLPWGGAVRINCLTGLPCPSRFMTQEPFFVKGYGTVAMVDELIQDVQTRRPLVIDAFRVSGGVVPSLNKELRVAHRGPVYCGFSNWGQTRDVAAALERFYALIERNYQVIDQSPSGSWVLYEHKSLIPPAHQKKQPNSTSSTL